MKTFLIRGVPASIQQDGWWMDTQAQRPPRRSYPDTAPDRLGRLERPMILLALIALGDVLLWGVVPTLSLALFGMILLGAALIFQRGQGWGGWVFGALCALPLIEQAQMLSVLFWLLGQVVGGVWIARGSWQGLRDMALSALRFTIWGPVSAIYDACQMVTRHTPADPIGHRLSRLGLGWAVPLGLGFVFLSLLVEANPVAQFWLDRAQDLRLPDPTRIVFWAGIGILIWPFLQLASLRQRLTPPARAALIGPRRVPAILNRDAVRRSLILFNVIFAVQTGMDMTYLWGGATLPEGMSHASYAHRGAYPLLVTALLAGAFALIARPFTGMDRLLRAALMIWLAQTVLLVVSSLIRLDLYIEVYGLTRLRMAAGIWMAVVATGLGLTIWQVLRHHSARWLLTRCAVLGLVVLYAAMFVSFDRAIARYNLTHNVPLDQHYICTLGSAALPEIRRHAPDMCDHFAHMRAPITTDWREWGFRDWRVLRSLAALNTLQAEQVTWPTY